MKQKNKEVVSVSYSVLPEVISFFIPLIGMFLTGFWGYRFPKRAKYIFIPTLIGIIIQGIIMLVGYFYLFEEFGSVLVQLIG